jgi:signal peptidase I
MSSLTAALYAALVAYLGGWFLGFWTGNFSCCRSPSLPSAHADGRHPIQNKFHYGVRLPVINKKIIDNNAVKRGDVMVFRYPIDPRQDYIKRVVGIPGDEVAYLNQKLSINGQPVATTAQGEHYDDDSLSYAPMFTEKLGDVEHKIRVDPRRQAYYGQIPSAFSMAENCRYA